MRHLATVVLCMLSLLSLHSVAQAAQDLEDPAPGMVRVRMSTSLGDMTFDLDGNKAPISVANFVQYVQDGFYTDTVFHRVMSDFMVQGGGISTDGTRKPTRPAILNEATNGLKNTYGTLSMARTRDAHTGTSQFFINVNQNTRLDHTAQNLAGWGYAVFGSMVDGKQTLEALRYVEVVANPQNPTEMSKPVDAPILKQVTILNPEVLGRVLAAADEAKAAAARAEEQAAAEARGRLEAQIMKAMAFISEQGVDVSDLRTSATGLQALDVVEGQGTMPKASDRVAVNYTLWLAEDGKKVDSSFDHPGGGPYKTALNAVIQGWTEGVTQMKEGGKRWLIIPPELGYGERGWGRQIPAGAVLVFEVELVEVGPEA